METNKRNSNEFLSAVSAERIRITDELFCVLAKVLNKIHGTSYSKRFWSILTSPYVSAVISCRQMMEVHNLSVKPEIDIYVNKINPDRKSIAYGKFRYFVKMIGSFRVLKETEEQLKSNYNLALGFHDQESIESEVDSFIKTYFPYLRNKKINHSKRKISGNFSDIYSEIFVRNLILFMPKLYIEYFDSLVKKVPLYEPDKKIFHISMLESFFMRLLVAKYVENGAKLFYYQHGAYYGEFKFHSAHHFESGIADKFMTWGWKINKNDFPSKAFRLEKFRRSYIDKKSKTIDLLLIYPTIEEKNVAHFKKESRVLFDRINRSKYPVICARPRPTSKFNRKSVLRFVALDVNNIDSGYTRLSDLISGTRLVVQMTYPSTNMFECMYVDQPAIALFNNDTPTDIIKPYYDYFFEKGVLHHSMDTLVAHLNSIDIEKWWKELTLDPIYLAFKNEFLRKV